MCSVTCTEARVAGVDEGRKEIRSGWVQTGKGGCVLLMGHIRADHLGP